MSKESQERIISWQQYSKHISPHNCWVLIGGYLYDVSDYLVEHPGGDDILIKYKFYLWTLFRYSGIDATAAFENQDHSEYAKSLRDARKLGSIETPIYTQEYRVMLQEKKRQLKGSKSKKKKEKPSVFRQNISLAQIATHNSEQSCWVIIGNKVYDVTQYMDQHPGGQKIMLDNGGKDATKPFKQALHSMSAVQKRQKLCIGTVQKASSISSLLILIVMLILIGSISWALFA